MERMERGKEKTEKWDRDRKGTEGLNRERNKNRGRWHKWWEREVKQNEVA